MPTTTSSNQVSLSLLPQFVRSHFPEVRSLLTGETSLDMAGSRLTVSVSVPAAVPSTPTQLKATLSHFSRVITHKALMLVMAVSVAVAAVLFVPHLYYALFPVDTVPIASQTDGTPMGGEFDKGANAVVRQRPVPSQDPSLPEGDWLVIPRIGVRTELQRTEDEEAALYKGVWQIPEYGTAGDVNKPMILAAHRYGWQWWWQTDYWKYHSFYNLPELEPGDMVEVISDQRKYYYEIYAGEEGEEITDYSGDMILYTCKFLNSPIRHFRYARLVDVAKNTQG